MARPDLRNPETLKAYRRELRAYLRPWRMLGLAVAVSSGLWLALKDPTSRAAWAVFIGAWILLIAIIVLRSRYHLRRMREPA